MTFPESYVPPNRRKGFDPSANYGGPNYTGAPAVGYNGYQQHHTPQHQPIQGFRGGNGGRGFGQGDHSYGSRGGFQNRHHGAPEPIEPYTREEVTSDDIFKDHCAGIDFSKYEGINVTITPNILPVETFAEMNLAASLMENVTRCNYVQPTPVQKYGIPAVLAGGDLMAGAQTGSGKTAAYLIPAICYIMNNGGSGSSGRSATPTALILSPTRELSIQIYEESRKFTYRSRVRSVVAYGGADPRHQLNEFARGCHLCVATPGRLWDFFSRLCVRFSEIRFLVLDEADRMLDMGFEPQIRQIVQGPETDMPRPGVRQTLLYSATFPKEIQQLAKEFLNPQHYFLQVGRVGSTTENITQEVVHVEDADKREHLINIISQHPSELILIFVEKRRDADYLERFLQSRQFSATSIHGDRVQRERENALAQFKSGRKTILVATDVASRGLDIPNVSLVVLYDLPSNIDSYVHRIGRTGRAGKTGKAISFYNEKNKNISDELVVIMQEAKQEVPQWLSEQVTRRFPGSRGGGRGGYRGGRGAFGGRGNGYRGGFNNGGGRGFGGGGQGQGGFRGFGNAPAWRPPQNSYGGGYQQQDNFSGGGFMPPQQQPGYQQ